MIISSSWVNPAVFTFFWLQSLYSCHFEDKYPLPSPKINTFLYNMVLHDPQEPPPKKKQPKQPKHLLPKNPRGQFLRSIHIQAPWPWDWALWWNTVAWPSLLRCWWPMPWSICYHMPWRLGVGCRGGCGWDGNRRLPNEGVGEVGGLWKTKMTSPWILWKKDGQGKFAAQNFDVRCCV